MPEDAVHVVCHFTLTTPGKSARHLACRLSSHEPVIAYGWLISVLAISTVGRLATIAADAHYRCPPHWWPRTGLMKRWVSRISPGAGAFWEGSSWEDVFCEVLP